MKMQRYCLILLSLLLFISCQKPPCHCEIDHFSLYKQDSLTSDAIANFGTRDVEYWQKFNEPSLFRRNVESYRFSITILLADYQKIYRIDREDEQARLYVKEYAVPTTTEFREDSLVRDTSRLLTALEWKNFKESLEANCFWTVPKDVERRVLDGSSWMLEGFHPTGNNCTNSDYHYAYRASPDSSRFKNISEEIIALDSFILKNLFRVQEYENPADRHKHLPGLKIDTIHLDLEEGQ